MVNQISMPNVNNIFMNQPSTSTASVMLDEPMSMKSDILLHPVRHGSSKVEGPLYNDKGFLSELQQGIVNQSIGASVFASGPEFSNDLSVPAELTAVDMSLSTLYLHELHHRQVYYF